MVTATAPKNTSEWKSPSFRPEGIEQLISSVDRYNPSNVALLEDYLDQQRQDGTYDLLANLAILKLYQFNPSLSSGPHATLSTLSILLSTLPLSTPPISPSFSLALSLALDRPPAALLPTSGNGDADDEDDEDADVDTTDYLGLCLPSLRQWESALREGRFREFWKDYENGKGEGADLLRSKFIPANPHLTTLIRLSIASTISSSFTRISSTHLQSFLGFKSLDQVKEFVETVEGWSAGDEGFVKIAGNGDNDVKAGVVTEKVELSQLTKLIAAANN